jgi:hypothetical protein
MEWLHLQHPDVWTVTFKINNEGKRSYYKAAILKAEGLKAGVPDIFMAYPNGFYHGLFLEFKINNNKPTEVQRYMMRQFVEKGYYCSVVYSFDEAVHVTECYLGEKKWM